MTPRKEARSPNTTPGSTPRRAQSLENNSFRSCSFTLPSHRDRASISSPEILEERQVLYHLGCTYAGITFL